MGHKAGRTPAPLHCACARPRLAWLPVPVALGASYRSGRDSLPLARTQQDKRTDANERTQPPYLSSHGLLTCILSQKQPRRSHPSALLRARARPPFCPFHQPGCSPAPRRELDRARKEAKPLSLRRLLQNLAQKLCACARVGITGPTSNVSVIQC